MFNKKADSLSGESASLLFNAKLSWAKKGVCSQVIPPKEADIFFNKKTEDRAKILCMICKVKGPCLFYAIDNDEEYGTWGGLSEGELKELRKN